MLLPNLIIILALNSISTFYYYISLIDANG